MLIASCSTLSLIPSPFVMLKETRSSLRAYFGLLAFLAIVPVVIQFSEGKLAGGSAWVPLLFGGLYVFSAMRMDHLLTRRPNFLRGILILNLLLSGLPTVIGILKTGRGLPGLALVAVIFSITAYLLSSVSRLAREASATFPTSSRLR